MTEGAGVKKNHEFLQNVIDGWPLVSPTFLSENYILATGLRSGHVFENAKFSQN